MQPGQSAYLQPPERDRARSLRSSPALKADIGHEHFLHPSGQLACGPGDLVTHFLGI